MVSKVCIAVKTKDRSPRENYLRGTLFNLERAGVLRSKHLHNLWVVDSGSGFEWLDDQMPSDYQWAIDTGRRTLHQNASRCIHVASREPGAQYAMVIEDDLDFVDDFLESVIAWVEDNPGFPMYVLGANYSQILGVVEHGLNLWPYPVGAFYGAQALVWRRDAAQELAEWLGPDPNYNGVKDHGHDLLLQRWGKEVVKAEFFAASAPSMVQHVGQDSGIGNRFFQFQSFPGRDWRYVKKAA